MANLFGDIQNYLSDGALNEAQALSGTAANAVNSITDPNLQALIPQLQKQVQQGTMTAAQYQAALQQMSAMSNVSSDQQSLGNEQQGLDQLKDIGTNGGMTNADRAQLAATMAQTNANAAGQRDATLQQLQMQGNGNGGAALAARLSGDQSSANSNAAAGAQVATAAQARALQAIQAGIQGNANMNNSLFAQQAQKAQAQDAVNQYNTQATNAANQYNATNQQQANATNFSTANQIMANNNQIANQQAMMPYQAAQQQFTNQLGQQTASANAQNTAAKNLAQQGQIALGVNNGYLNGVGNVTKDAINAAGGLGNIGSSISGLFGNNSAASGLDTWNGVADGALGSGAIADGGEVVGDIGADAGGSLLDSAGSDLLDNIWDFL